MKQNTFKIHRVLLPLLFPFLALVGCGDKECKQTVQDVAVIQNMTGYYNLQLFVCKGNYGESRIQLLPANYGASGVVNIGTHEEVAGKADALGVCKTKNTTNSSIPLTLSPNSYGSVLLCYSQVNNAYIVTLPSQGCPNGYAELATPEGCSITAN